MPSKLKLVRLVVPAAKAKPTPVMGQALGPLGVNMMEFCKQFNSRTLSVREGTPLQVQMTVNHDSSFKFWMRSPHTTWFLRRVARVPTGSDNPSKEVVGNVTIKEVYHIALAKQFDAPNLGKPLQAVMAAVIGSARSIGIEVTPVMLRHFYNRNRVPVGMLDQQKKDMRQRKKAEKRKLLMGR